MYLHGLRAFFFLYLIVVANDDKSATTIETQLNQNRLMALLDPSEYQLKKKCARQFTGRRTEAQVCSYHTMAYHTQHCISEYIRTLLPSTSGHPLQLIHSLPSLLCPPLQPATDSYITATATSVHQHNQPPSFNKRPF